MRFLSFQVAAVTILTMSLSAARAELPLLRPEQKKQMASHIVYGEVKAVYTTDKEREKKGFVDTLYAIEIAVEKVDKGDGLKKGEVVFARTWRRKDRPPGWVGPGGQFVIPKVGDKVRAYLKRGEDGAYEILIRNGIDVVPEEK